MHKKSKMRLTLSPYILHITHQWGEKQLLGLLRWRTSQLYARPCFKSHLKTLIQRWNPWRILPQFKFFNYCHLVNTSCFTCCMFILWWECTLVQCNGWISSKNLVIVEIASRKQCSGMPFLYCFVITTTGFYNCGECSFLFWHVLSCLSQLQTTKFLYGCAVNAFILKDDWLTNSISADYIVPPEQ